MTKQLKLGLIGDNIAMSQSPKLHQLAGLQSGIPVSYTRLVPKDMGLSFEALFSGLRQEGYHGVNVTYPYKERAAGLVTVANPLVRAIGAVNTVVLAGATPHGYNTDYSGFIHAYRTVRGNAALGKVVLIGAGGVGKAIAFALLTLGTTEIVCVDLEREKARALANALVATGTSCLVTIARRVEDAVEAADGIINCTPLGMVGIGGTPLNAALMAGANWVFDAVYTPVQTQFLQDAQAVGLTAISGYALFFGQGIDAWRLFSGTEPDVAALRAALTGDTS
ncbi:shikimate dehydrogenase [Sulfitobacter sp. SK012]|uniref:shikimate dehydrogenase family protein n=1 Tax=Sulfitobacter sp. SK012 TaxID=1389005 RepID=UPI000E0A7472|nr:shikimate dehydrogenase [Sulfitobacter sp. SK012]AXI47536.1 shikimate dehydrogenase [Sulfitobacter sp. SK012]